MDDDDNDEGCPPEKIPSHQQAAEMLDQCTKWYEYQEEATPTSLILLRKIRDLAIKKRHENLKQITLDAFFRNQ